MNDPGRLAIPDTRTEVVPVGWWDQVARVEIDGLESWDALEEYEARLQAFVAYIEAGGGDALEYEKALRVVEKRRGELLDPRRPVGRPAGNSAQAPNIEPDVSDRTKERWRAIADHWDVLYKHLLEATDRKQVRQATLVKLARLEDVREQRHAAEANRVAGGPPPSEFSAIVIDPPWPYENRATRGAAEDHYETMTLDDLAGVFDVMREQTGFGPAANSHLYLWVTNGFLREGFDLMDAWGFDYKACLTWCKPQIGMGNYFRNATEHVYFGMRGNLPTEANNISTWFVANRTQHSAKPEQFYDIVERSSPGPFLEMFARRRRMGWEVWGDEA